MLGHLGKYEEKGLTYSSLEGGDSPKTGWEWGESANLCPKTKKSLDLEINSPVLKKCPISNWERLLSPSNVALGT